MTAAEPRIPRHRFYAKEHHVQLARDDKDKRFIRGSGIDRIDGGSAVTPPVNDTAPILAIADAANLLYTAGVWSGSPAPVVTARVIVDGADVAPATPGNIPTQWAWFGKPVMIRESAENGEEAPVTANSNTVTPTAPAGFGIGLNEVDSRRGYRRSGPNYGFVNPETVAGAQIFTLFSDPGDPDRMAFGMVGGVQIGSANYVDITLEGFSGNPMRLNWNFDEYRNYVVGSEAYFLSKVGQIVAFTITPEGVPPSLDEQVQAILAGTKGYALDPQDASTLFQDIAGTVPVTTAGQAVARINGKWGVGSAANWSNNGAAARPVWTGNGLVFDGVDDGFNGAAGVDFIKGAPAGAHVVRAQLNDSGQTQVFTAHSTPIASQTRFGTQVNVSEQMVLLIRRPDGAGFNSSFATPLVPLGVPVTLSWVSDAAGSALGSAFVGGVAATPQATGAAAPFDDTVGPTFRMGRALGAGTIFFSGTMGRQVFCPFAPTPAQRAILEAWVSEGPFDPPPPPSPAQ